MRSPKLSSESSAQLMLETSLSGPPERPAELLSELGEKTGMAHESEGS
eukprot:CAMPEP_0171551116 /NCGR_PEP_ID=MMETSP0960-20121227/7486_1 /TAXON_ID=87120 /ORGANISM="Aurantiochytrium limacinum, Strain ATCCMYA-1381" /LENGTH=47 /DNA_ID= /DNA_START= /DNA_END= /DNA_ORIENTATION=